MGFSSYQNILKEIILRKLIFQKEAGTSTIFIVEATAPFYYINYKL